MKKPNLFIGSSSEAKDIAYAIKDILSEYVDIKIWDQPDIFNLGDQYLDSLRRQILLSDFALLIIYPDDEIIKRNKIGYTPRDNVLLELGLFLGALGKFRGFYVTVSDKRGGQNKAPNIPSDLDGLTKLNLTMVDSDTQMQSSLESLCSQLKESISRNQDRLRFDLLPSTSLAIGYFNNFIYQVGGTLSQIKNITINGKEYDLTREKFIFNIVLPDIFNASHEGYGKFIRDNNLEKISVKGITKTSRDFPFYVELTKNEIKFYDFATTILSTMETVDFVKPEGTTNKESDVMKKRELANFTRTLEFFLQRDSRSSGFRDNILIISENELK